MQMQEIQCNNVQKKPTRLTGTDERQTAALIARNHSTYKYGRFICLALSCLLISTGAFGISFFIMNNQPSPSRLMPATYASDHKWLHYLQKVYKNSYPNTTTFPVDLSNLRLLYLSVLQNVGIDIYFPECTLQTHSGELYRYRSGFPFETNDYAFIAPPPLQPLLANTWVEVTHCPKEYETDVYWMYHSPGSGVWVNTGITLVLDSFNEVCKYLGEQKSCWHSGSGLANLPEKMREFDTLQVLRRHGDTCAARHLELIHLKYLGNQTCGPPMRAGWNAQLVCSCSAIKDVTACATCM